MSAIPLAETGRLRGAVRRTLVVEIAVVAPQSVSSSRSRCLRGGLR